MIVPQIHNGGSPLISQKSLFLLMIVLFFGSSAVAQKKTAKASAPAAPKKEITDKDVPHMSIDQLILAIANKKPVVIIDVRHKGDYSHKIKGALQIPLDEIEARMKEIPRNKEIVAYCACPAEQTSNAAAVKLLNNGYKKVFALKGGWKSWLEAAGTTEPSN
jgi:rhodanese-related sulfurtransferase